MVLEASARFLGLNIYTHVHKGKLYFSSQEMSFPVITGGESYRGSHYEAKGRRRRAASTLNVSQKKLFMGRWIPRLRRTHPIRPVPYSLNIECLEDRSLPSSGYVQSALVIGHSRLGAKYGPPSDQPVGIH